MPRRDAATLGWRVGGDLGWLGMNSWRAGIGFGLFGGRYRMCRGMRGVIAGRI